MCSLQDIYYADKQGSTVYVYEYVDEDGHPMLLSHTLTRESPRNIADHINFFLDDQRWCGPYICHCGSRFANFDHVLDHCDMYRCRDCDKLVNRWAGWDYRCPPCAAAYQEASRTA